MVIGTGEEIQGLKILEIEVQKTIDSNQRRYLFLNYPKSCLGYFKIFLVKKSLSQNIFERIRWTPLLENKMEMG